MKKYVFLSCGVFGIGGGQLYVSNKAEYLIQKGYKVYSISTSGSCYKNGIEYGGLMMVQNSILDEMSYYPEAYTHIKREKIIKKAIRTFSFEENDEIIIESNSLLCAAWAEKIAQRIKCKHIIFSISEKNPINDYLFSFLEFKFNRGELATIAARTFKELIELSSIITEQNIPVLRAYLGDPISEEIDERLENIETSDYNICIIGRGEKRYIEYSCLSLINFCKKHADDTFTVGLVSAFSDKNKEQYIKDQFASLNNVKVYYLGYFSPIPRRLFEMFDLYIGGAGCASLPYRQNVLTLAMDLHNDRPLGFMGYDVYKTVETSLSEADIEAFLEDAFFKKEYLKKQYIPSPQLSASEAFSYHDKFLENSNKIPNYYMKKNRNVSFNEKIKATLSFLIKIKRKLVK